MTYRVTGLTELTRGLRKLGVSLDDLKAMFDEIARVATEKVSEFAPVRSGALRATVRGSHARNKAVVSVGTARVRYAGPINYGWPARGIKPSDFTGRAETALAPELPGMVHDAINKVIREAGL